MLFFLCNNPVKQPTLELPELLSTLLLINIITIPVYDVTIQSMKITASVTKSSHQDRGMRYFFTLNYFFLYIHSALLLEN